MLEGKLNVNGARFVAQVGNIEIDVTEGVEELLHQQRVEFEQKIAELRAEFAEIVQKWARVVEIVGYTGPVA